MGELRKIPNIGKRTEQDLIGMGYTTVESLKGKTADELYAEECAMRGCVIDRCQLYLFRAVEYFVNTENPDPGKCRWWLWKDDFATVTPCGLVCAECQSFPSLCKGCRATGGQGPWLKYAGLDRCPVYTCCVEEKGMRHCGFCRDLPCGRYTKDPTVSDEENAAHLKMMTENLAKAAREDRR